MKLLIKDQKGEDSLLYKSLFLQEMIEKGVFMHPNAILLSYSHSKENIEYTLTVMNDALKNLSQAIQEDNVQKLLRGNVAKQVIKMLPT